MNMTLKASEYAPSSGPPRKRPMSRLSALRLTYASICEPNTLMPKPPMFRRLASENSHLGRQDERVQRKTTDVAA